MGGGVIIALLLIFVGIAACLAIATLAGALRHTRPKDTGNTPEKEDLQE